MTDASFKTNAALAPQLGVVQAKTFAMAVPTAVAPDALCPTCAKEPVVTIPGTEPVHPPTSPATSPQPTPPVVPTTSAPTLPTSSFLDQELGKLRQEFLQGIATPSVPVTAPSVQPMPSTMPRPITTPALALAAPRELLWSQLGVGYVGMQPFTRPMMNGGLSGTMTGSQPSAGLGPQSLAVRVASLQAQAGIAYVLEYLSTLQSGGSLASVGVLKNIAARLSDAHSALLVEQCSSALESVGRALELLKSADAVRSTTPAVRNGLMFAIKEGVGPPLILCNEGPSPDEELTDGCKCISISVYGSKKAPPSILDPGGKDPMTGEPGWDQGGGFEVITTEPLTTEGGTTLLPPEPDIQVTGRVYLNFRFHTFFETRGQGCTLEQWARGFLYIKGRWYKKGAGGFEPLNSTDPDRVPSIESVDWVLDSAKPENRKPATNGANGEWWDDAAGIRAFPGLSADDLKPRGVVFYGQFYAACHDKPDGGGITTPVWTVYLRIDRDGTPHMIMPAEGFNIYATPNGYSSMQLF